MTALGFLYPGHGAEDDYPRAEQLLGSDIRLDVVHTAGAEGPPGVDALRATGTPERLAAGVEGLRLAGVEAVVWASTGGSFVYGPQGAHDQVRALAVTAGMPASSTSFAFVHAAQEIGARRVAVAATYPDDVAGLFADFLRAGGVEVTGVHASAAGDLDETALIALARQADRPDADAVLIPDTALRTVAHLPALERALAKPVLTANQVTAWEALRLTDRRVNAPALGALFTREPIVQV
ncbi:maleate cis-trans isomerase family protein [Streptomyces brasiliensis]|uniref:Decarboxylase n=1 Tax=Streptomyces brasiliensis TaxID=1954 RepID=A0A917NQ24_9ACTN|nr:aspartate/glutamate racemase family protein [Streptomyces brasiliensis]GGJ17502.1 decarboxylase [Streptomyces brasiliensis]